MLLEFLPREENKKKLRTESPSAEEIIFAKENTAVNHYVFDPISRPGSSAMGIYHMLWVYTRVISVKGMSASLLVFFESASRIVVFIERNYVIFE